MSDTKPAEEPPADAPPPQPIPPTPAPDVTTEVPAPEPVPEQAPEPTPNPAPVAPPESTETPPAPEEPPATPQPVPEPEPEKPAEPIEEPAAKPSPHPKPDPPATPQAPPTPKGGIPPAVLALTDAELKAAAALYAQRHQREFSRKGVEVRQARMHKNLDLVLAQVRRHGTVQIPRLTQDLDMSPGLVSNYLLMLLKQGKVKATGHGAGRRYSA